MKRNYVILLALSFLPALFFACKQNDAEKLRRMELEKLDAFIQENYPNVERKPSGLYYIETQAGTGDSIKVGDRVQIFYSTWTLDSILIDETNGYSEGYRYEPYEFVVGGDKAIQGLQEAATYMQQGTKATLIIPSELAYKTTGTTGVPGFTTLLMQVEVYKVYPAQTQ